MVSGLIKATPDQALMLPVVAVATRGGRGWAAASPPDWPEDPDSAMDVTIGASCGVPVGDSVQLSACLEGGVEQAMEVRS